MAIEGKSVGIAAGVGASTFFLGMLAHRLATDSPLPLETFDWVLRNGAAGFFLAALLVVAVAYERERRGRLEDAARCAAEIKTEREARSVLEERYAAKVEALMREYSPLLKKVTRVLAINSEVIRGKSLTSSDAAELSDQTPPDASPLLPPREE